MTPPSPRPQAASSWAGILDRLIPPLVKADVEALPRARVLIGLGLAGSASSLVFGVLSLVRLDLPVAGVCGAALMLNPANLLLLWKTQRLGPSATLSITQWVVLVIAAGGITDAGSTIASGWPVFTIVLATYLLGSRAGGASALAFALVLIPVAHLQQLGVLSRGDPSSWSTGSEALFASFTLLLLSVVIATLQQRAYGRMVVEVTEANQNVERSAASLRTVLDSTRDDICSVDRDLRIVEMNGAFRSVLAKRLGRSSDLGVPFFEGVDPHASEGFRERLREGIEGALRGQHVEFEEAVSAPGRSITYAISIDPVRLADQSVVGATLFRRDITERRQLEARSMISDRMTSVGTLAAGVAHELNNPLAYVVANLDFVTSELDPAAEAAEDSREEVARALAEAREGAERMKVIIRDLKTFSRADDQAQGSIEVEPALEAAIKMCHNELRHRARLERDYAALPPIVGNVTRLEQVVLNLLVNATHATPEGEAHRNTITLRTRRQEPDRVVIEVIDTGSGIAPENLKRVFDPFFTTKPVGVGTGLGLSICHNLIQGMGGEIQVESQLGKGSTFRLILPAVVSAAPAQPVRAPSAVESSPRARVLLIDDEVNLGSALRRALRKYGHELVAETRGSAALERLRGGERFDLVLCDLMMPEMTGMELFEQLQKLAPDQVGRVAFLSGGAFSAGARKFIERVQQPVLSKPCEVKQIAELILRVQRTGTTLSSLDRVSPAA